MLLSMTIMAFCFGMINGILLLAIILEGLNYFAPIGQWMLYQIQRPFKAIKNFILGVSDDTTLTEDSTPETGLNKGEHGICRETKCPRHQSNDSNCPTCFIASEY